MSAQPVPFRLFLGTYGKNASAGIYRVTFDPISGGLDQPVRVAELVRPSFLAYSPDRRRLYSLDHGDNSVVAFAVDPHEGGLRELNRQALGTNGGCYLGTDFGGRMLVAIAYSDGAVASFPLEADGRLGPRASLVRHEGSGPNPERQEKPHAHSATFSPDDRFVYVCDLGTDRVVAYRANPQGGTLAPVPEADGTVPPGHGARHAKMTRDGRFLYVVNEMAGSVSVFARDPASGRLDRLETVSTLRDGFSGDNGSSEIWLHPNERFLYAANRGPDDLAVLERTAEGRLKRIYNVPTEGAHPRHFAGSADGRWLVCANRDSNNLVVFAIDPETGHLRLTPHRAAVPEPVCVLFP